MKSSDKQKKAKGDRLQAICVIGKRFRGDPGQTCYIATADISGITWLHNNYMCHTYVTYLARIIVESLPNYTNRL